MNLRSRNNYPLAEELEYAYLRTLTPAQTMHEFLDLFDAFRHQMDDDGSLQGDDHRSSLLFLQNRLAQLRRGPATPLA